MLEVSFIRNNKNKVLEALEKRRLGKEELAVIDQVIALDDQRKQVQTQLDEMLAERNKLSKEIGQLFKSGKAQEANTMKAKVAELKDKSAGLEEEFKSIKLFGARA